MNASTKASSGHSDSNPPEVKEYLVRRDGDRPLSFAGTQLAKASRQQVVNNQSEVETLEAALYRTQGGKYITSLTKIAIRAPVTAFQGSINSARAVHEAVQA